MDKVGVYSGQYIVYLSSCSLLRSDAACIFSKQLPNVFQTLQKHFPSFVNFPTFHTLCWSKFSARNAFTSQEFSIFQWFQIIWDFFVRTHVQINMMFISSPRGTVCLRVILLGNIRRRRCRHPHHHRHCHHHRIWRKRRNCVIILSSSKLAQQAPELCHYCVIIEAGASAGAVSLFCHHQSWRKRRN